MSNEPGGSAPLPDPYTAPGGHQDDRGPVPPPPSGYEAVLPPPAPYSAPAPVYPSSAPYPSTGPAPSAPPPTDGNPFAPPQGEPTSPYAAPVSAQPSYGPPPTASAYGQAPPSAYDAPYGATPYGTASYGTASYGTAPYGGAPYGTAPYGSAPYGSTPYGSAYPGGPMTGPQTEPLATASMVTSLVGLVVLTGLACPVGLGLGIAALRRIRRNGKQGRGMAIAGIAVGAFGTLCLVAAVAVAVAFISGDWDSSGSSSTYGNNQADGSDPLTDGDTMPDYTLRTDLLVGDCLDYYAYEWDMSDSSVVGCDVPHEGEVVATITMSGPSSTSTSADDPVWIEASDECTAQADALLLDSADLGEVVLYAPHPDDFASGGTTAYCTFFTSGDLFTGSVVQHTLTQVTTGSAT